MFSVALDKVINSIVESPLARAAEPSEMGLLVELDIEVFLDEYDELEERSSARTRCFFLFRRASNYINVWWAIPEKGYYPDANEWENTSNHDSCWRLDGVDKPLRDLYYEMCKQVDPEKAPIELRNFLWNFTLKHVLIEGLRINKDRRYEFDMLRPVEELS